MAPAACGVQSPLCERGVRRGPPTPAIDGFFPQKRQIHEVGFRRGLEPRAMQRVLSFALRGIDAVPIEIECDEWFPSAGSGTPGGEGGRPARFVIVGLPDASVRESAQRVRAALGVCQLPFPKGNCTVNLAPADIRKEGPVFDLAIAVAILRMQGVIGAESDRRLDRFLIAGELALDGKIRPIRGATSMAVLARAHGLRGVILPAENAAEAAIVDGVETYGVSHLGEAVGFINDRLPLTAESPPAGSTAAFGSIPDFQEIRGQEGAKRALAIAAAGGHNVLLIGPAGSGKTMMARALPAILPPLGDAESLEVTRIHSVAGTIAAGTGLVRQRPFRSPHHSASAAALVGGGSIPRPGEVSLAHHGVLFLDELPEFPRLALECLREPLEDGFVTISRASGTLRFPARAMLVAAMNPSHQGGFARSASERQAQERYIGRLSGPLLDRIDLHVEVRAVGFQALRATRPGASTDDLRQRVLSARERMTIRQGRDRPNAVLRGKELDVHCPLEGAAQGLLESAMQDLRLSARAYDRIRRTARTVADLEGSEAVLEAHVAEAIHYRILDRLRATAGGAA